MKRNQFFNFLKIQHFKDTIPKFGPCLKKSGDFITPESCVILLSKVVFASRGQNVRSRDLMTKCGQNYDIAIRYGVYWLYTTSISLSSFEDSETALNLDSLDMLFRLRSRSLWPIPSQHYVTRWNCTINSPQSPDHFLTKIEEFFAPKSRLNLYFGEL